MPQGQYVLREFQKAVLLHKGKDVVNLDDKFQFDFTFFIERFERIFPKKIKRVPPNKWSYHRIGLITEGNVEFVTANSRIPAKKNFLVIVPSRIITSSKDWSDNIRGYILLFNSNFFIENGLPATALQNKKILTGVMQPYVILNDDQAGILKRIFEELIKENEKEPGRVNELLAIKTYELIIQAERFFSEEQQFEKNLPIMDIVLKFMDLIENHFTEERSVNFYAGQLNLHPNYLNTLIKKHTGFTAKETIQNRLILEIKYLLHTTSLSIKEISSRLTFKDPNYLTTLFTKAEKLSPAQYRTTLIS